MRVGRAASAGKGCSPAAPAATAVRCGSCRPHRTLQLTVGIFLRLRTASLTEIQLRLGALEALIASKPETSQE